MDVTIYLFFMAFLMALAAWCIFLWAIRDGQFGDIEESKYQIVPRPPAPSGTAPPVG